MTDLQTQVVELHPLAPPKAAYGTECNGCGVCCALEPCPVAFLFLFQFRGECRALLWENAAKRYVCGMVVSPEHYLKFMPSRLSKRMGRFFAARIASGYGCDLSAEVLNGHGNSVTLKNETRDARFPHLNPLPQAGEEANESLREFHFNE